MQLCVQCDTAWLTLILTPLFVRAIITQNNVDASLLIIAPGNTTSIDV